MNSCVKSVEFQRNGWQFIFTDSSISNSDHATKIQKLMELNNFPDCFFENNRAFIVNESEQFCFMIDPKAALHLCNFEEMSLQYEAIHKSNFTIIKPQRIHNTSNHVNSQYCELDNTSEIFLSSPYMGSIFNRECFQFCLQQIDQINELQNPSNSISSDFQSSEGALNQYQIIHNQVTHSIFVNKKYTQQTNEMIPTSNLTGANPIIWSHQIILYEDDYGDNGCCRCDFKFRVMSDCFYGLLRTYVRVDNNLVRIYDTRIYHEFGQKHILRVFEEKENTWAELIEKGFKFESTWMIDQNQSHLIDEFMDLKKVFRQKIHFNSTI